MADPTKPFNQVLSDALTHFLTNWKTSVSALCSLALAWSLVLMMLPACPHWLSTTCLIVSSLAKATIGVIQKDCTACTPTS